MEDSMSSEILTKKEGKIGIITLNRPDNFNTFTVEFAKQLNNALVNFDNDDEVVVIVINANGKHFCVGISLDAFNYKNEGEYTEFIRLMDKHNHTIFNMKKPVISSVQGLAIANGAGLSYACDLTVAADTAKFGTTAINVGLICTGPGAPLSKEVSRKKAMEMVLMGEMFSAQEAKEHGLVNRVVPEDKLEEETMAFANKLAEKSPLALQAGKRGLCMAYAKPYFEAVEDGSLLFAQLCNTEDAKEGLAAFSEKRQPNWKNK
jgi:enoyl-CoA hydratase/carnithine racemase